MTLCGLLLAYQESPLPGVPKESGWVASAVMLAILLWREFTKSRAEREATQVTGYKDLADRATATATKAQGEIGPLTKQVSQLTDDLVTAKLKIGDLENDLENARKDLERATKELAAVRSPGG